MAGPTKEEIDAATANFSDTVDKFVAEYNATIKAQVDSLQQDPSQPNAKEKYAQLVADRNAFAKKFTDSVQPQATALKNLQASADKTVRSDTESTVLAALRNVRAFVQVATAEKAFILGPLKATIEKANAPEIQTPEAGKTDPGATGASAQAPGTSNTASNQASDDKGNASSGSANTNNSVSTQAGIQATGQNTNQGNNATGAAGTTTAGKAGTNAATPPPQVPGRRLYNPLGWFASYTYLISLYMVTPEAYNAFILSGRKNLEIVNSLTGSKGGAFIIAQSGGINNTASRRADGFALDYYIDDLRIKTATNGKSTQTSANFTEMYFSVYEPYGFSFVTNLKKARNQIEKLTQNPKYKNQSNATRQIFVLGLTFTGYDQNGNIITSDSPDGINAGDGTTYYIPNRYYDIIFSEFKYKIDGKTIKYDIKAAPFSTQQAYGIKHGRTKAALDVQGETVFDILLGDTGLISKINYQQQSMAAGDAGNKKCEIPNTYNIEFVGSEAEVDRLKNAKAFTPEDVDKLKKGALAPVKTLGGVNPREAFKSVPDTNSRVMSFPGDTAIIQAINQIYMQSDYLYDSLTKIYESNADSDNNDESKKSGQKDRNISWFNISPRIEVTGWDNIINDWAYNITYVIQPYSTPVVTSSYAKGLPKYYGPHKRYQYWYTGKNSEIISYEQSMSNNYFNVAIQPSNDTTQNTGEANVPTGPQMQQNQIKGDLVGYGAQAQTSYLTSLYDPGAYAKARVQIIGDPDFLMQEGAASINDVYNKFYGSDGFTINANGGQVFIEIDFNEAIDYDTQNGILSINDKILFWNYPKELNIKGISYMVVDVTSTFSKGKFVQDLSLTINTFSQVTTKSDAGRASGQNAKPSTEREGKGDQPVTSATGGLKADPSSFTNQSGFGSYKDGDNPEADTSWQPPAQPPAAQVQTQSTTGPERTVNDDGNGGGNKVSNPAPEGRESTFSLTTASNFGRTRLTSGIN